MQKGGMKFKKSPPPTSTAKKTHTKKEKNTMATSNKKVISSDTVKKNVSEYFKIAGEIKNLELKKSELLNSIVESCRHENAKIGSHTLSLITRSGNVSYKSIVDDLLPNAPIEQYRGDRVSFWMLK